MAQKKQIPQSGKNNNNYIVFDFETGGIDPLYHEPIQIAAMAFDPRKLEPYPDGIFSSMMRPPGKVEDWKIEKAALDINKKTIQEIEAAPAREEVWRQFCLFVNRFNKKNSIWTAPIACGQNIKNFDLIIAERLCLDYNILNSEKKPKLFNGRNSVDLVDITFLWFENEDKPINRKMDTLREFFNMPTEGAHDALVDVKQTAELIFRFIRLHRRLTKTIPWRPNASTT
jgi:DNA polymerase III epsilon subunit-like protein